MSNKSTVHKSDGLQELPATAICGNDITSSCLYVSALAIMAAGKWAWLALLLVAVTLYLFRKIYGEVVGALPLNGGAYNALLNTTSKRLASMAACLTILSYMATAVISASEAIHYTHSLIKTIPVIPATIVLLTVFTGLTILGIGESSRVAVVIFITHLATLVILLIVGGCYLALHGLDTLTLNFSMPSNIGFGQALFFGFAAAMLGISGFESSANFVEEQAEGVFPKTLRNMWIAVSFFNPMIAILALALIPIPEVPEHQEALLAHMGAQAGGPWLALIVSVDAALVLSGAVLTSFVGVTGLVHRMTLDRCLPQFLLKKNKYGSSHRIIIGFLMLAISVLLVTGGDLAALAGVYTISFLAVMALFGVGNILLKVRRASLPRPIKASWPALLVGISAVMIGVTGNLVMHPKYFSVFLAYFIPTVFIVLIMLGRIGLLRTSLFLIGSISDLIAGATSKISDRLNVIIQQIQSQQMVFFTRGDNVANLNRAMIYVRRNEHTNRIKVVTVVENENEVPKKLREEMKFLDSAYPDIKIEFLAVKGEFGPKLIQELSRKWKIPVNLMFIGSPGTKFIYGLAELGGVRLII
jgi:amino acid transporter